MTRHHIAPEVPLQVDAAIIALDLARSGRIRRAALHSAIGGEIKEDLSAASNDADLDESSVCLKDEFKAGNEALIRMRSIAREVRHIGVKELVEAKVNALNIGREGAPARVERRLISGLHVRDEILERGAKLLKIFGGA